MRISTRRIRILMILAGLCASTVAAVAVGPVSAPGSPAARELDLPQAEALFDLIAEFEADGAIVGAQMAIAHRGEIVARRNYGVVAPDRPAPVNDATLFCIGSVSKPLASVLLLGLVDDGLLELDVPVDRWLPRFATPVLQTGEVAPRAPTLRELLTHRGGIYSQFFGLTPVQVNLIRNFKRSLKQAVRRIGRQPLFDAPGERFAYSGAGYLVAGRLGEVVTDTDWNELFRSRLAGPLEMERTTFFPESDDDNVAAGAAAGSSGTDPEPSTPHLWKKFRLALVGGSAYSTATELTRFGTAIGRRGKVRGAPRLLRNSTWMDMTDTARDMPRGWQPYGMGWQLWPQQDSTRPRWLYHSGGLAANIAYLGVDPRGDYSVAITLAVADWSGNSGARLQNAFDNLMGALTGQ